MQMQDVEFCDPLFQCVRHSRAVIEAAEIRKFGFSLPPFYEIPNGVEIPAEGPDATRESNTVLFLGRLDWKKGIERLISSMISSAPLLRLAMTGVPALRASGITIDIPSDMAFEMNIDAIAYCRASLLRGSEATCSYRPLYCER